MGSELVSYEAVGALCGASRQAVWKSGDCLRWVQARCRRFLVPGRPGSLAAASAVARAAAGEMVAAARRRVAALRPWSGRGRRVAREPAALADLLGVRALQGDDLVDVFERWLLARVADLARAAGEPRGVRRWLDGSWMPRWVRREVGRWPGAAPEPEPQARRGPRSGPRPLADAEARLLGRQKPAAAPAEWDED